MERLKMASRVGKSLEYHKELIDEFLKAKKKPLQPQALKHQNQEPFLHQDILNLEKVVVLLMSVSVLGSSPCSVAVSQVVVTPAQCSPCSALPPPQGFHS